MITPAGDVFGNDFNPAIEDDDFQLPLREASGIAYIDNLDADLIKVSVEVTWT